MRTTLDIEDDLLQAAKELARREGVTAGAVVSRLVRQALTQAPAAAPKRRRATASVAGFEPFAARPGVLVTQERVQQLREAEGI